MRPTCCNARVSKASQSADVLLYETSHEACLDETGEHDDGYDLVEQRQRADSKIARARMNAFYVPICALHR